MHKNSPPVLIDSDNLSTAWAQVMLALAERGVDEISPLNVSITGFDSNGMPQENGFIRNTLEAFLATAAMRDVENVAFTIFPERYWRIADGDRNEFFRLYRDAFPRIQNFEPRHNRRGSYFQRLVDFEGADQGFNQLAWILDEYEQRPQSRRSKWQASTFDPRRDLSAAGQLEFPCLQQVSFTFAGADGLVINAFYATQQILRKGYGNYLGLSRLGAFMAQQMRRRLLRLNVFVGVAHIDNEIGKTDPRIAELLRVAALQAADGAAAAQTTAPAMSSV